MGEKPLKEKKKLLENSCDLACQMYLIIRIFPVSLENFGTFSGTFFSVWKILCPLWALGEEKIEVSCLQLQLEM